MSAHANSTVADVLRRAKARIDTPEKWAKHGRDGDACCAHLAIADVAEVGEQRQTTMLFLKKGAVLENGLGDWDAEPVWSWNDAPERTHADVMAAFDRAIALAEAEGA